MTDKPASSHRAGCSRHSLLTVALALAAMTWPARADITPLSSSLQASSVADVDPDQVNVPVTDQDSTPNGNLRNLTVNTFANDALPPDVTEAVTTHASVTYNGNNTIVVNLFGARSGTDPTLGPPGGEYESKASFALEFQNLASDNLSVDWSLSFVRPNTGTFTPLGIGLRRGGTFDSRGPSIAFDSLSGIAAGSEPFSLDRTGFAGVYTLELDLAMVGRTSNLLPAEQWDATFTVHTPAMTSAPVPEPELPLLLLCGLGVLGWRFRRRPVRA